MKHLLRPMVRVITTLAVALVFIGVVEGVEKLDTDQQKPAESRVAFHMRHATSARDFKNEPLLSGHHFLRAAKIAEDAGMDGARDTALLGFEHLDLVGERTLFHRGDINDVEVIAGQAVVDLGLGGNRGDLAD